MAMKITINGNKIKKVRRVESTPKTYSNKNEYMAMVYKASADYLRNSSNCIKEMMEGYAIGFVATSAVCIAGVKAIGEASAITIPIVAKTYSVNKDRNVLNSSGRPKNPPSADDVPDHDITVDDMKPGPFDQHGTYGQAGD